jgi:hypothetical protein
MANSDDSESEGPPDTWNYTEHVSSRISPQTYERFEQYTEQKGVGQSEAVRLLIRSGLDHELDEDGTAESGSGNALPDLALGVGVVMIGTALATGEAASWVIPTGGTLAVIGAYYRWFEK